MAFSLQTHKLTRSNGHIRLEIQKEKAIIDHEMAWHYKLLRKGQFPGANRKLFLPSESHYHWRPRWTPLLLRALRAPKGVGLLLLGDTGALQAPFLVVMKKPVKDKATHKAMFVGSEGLELPCVQRESLKEQRWRSMLKGQAFLARLHKHTERRKYSLVRLLRLRCAQRVRFDQFGTAV